MYEQDGIKRRAGQERLPPTMVEHKISAIPQPPTVSTTSSKSPDLLTQSTFVLPKPPSRTSTTPRSLIAKSTLKPLNPPNPPPPTPPNSLLPTSGPRISTIPPTSQRAIEVIFVAKDAEQRLAELFGPMSSLVRSVRILRQSVLVFFDDAKTASEAFQTVDLGLQVQYADDRLKDYTGDRLWFR